MDTFKRDCKDLDCVRFISPAPDYEVRSVHIGHLLASVHRDKPSVLVNTVTNVYIDHLFMFVTDLDMSVIAIYTDHSFGFSL